MLLVRRKAALRCGEKRHFGVAKSGTSVWRKAALRCFERRCGGVAKSWCCGKAGIAELRMLLVLRRRSVGLASGWHPFRFSSGLRAGRSYGQFLRSADIKADGGDGFHRRRTSSEVKANGHGWFHVESWRDPAHGRRRSWAFGERREAEGRALPAEGADRIRGDRAGG